MPARSDQEKLAIIKEAYAEGADKEAVVKKHGITKSTLYGWKSDLTNGHKASRKAQRNSSQRSPPDRVSRDDFLAALHLERKRLQESIDALDIFLKRYQKK